MIMFTNIDVSSVDAVIDQLANVPVVLSGFIEPMPDYVKVAFGLSIMAGFIRIIYNILIQ